MSPLRGHLGTLRLTQARVVKRWMAGNKRSAALELPLNTAPFELSDEQANEIVIDFPFAQWMPGIRLNRDP